MANKIHHQPSLDQAFTEYPTSDVFENYLTAKSGNAGSSFDRTLRPDEIRLVRISEHGIDGAKGIIRCTTCIVPRHRKTEYTAVSYTWGSPIALDRRYRIKLDDREILLSKNLWRFLEHGRDARRALPSGWLWIDALSIDQHSPWERSHQVQKMAEIFGDADEVLVWLGPRYGGSEKAMKSLTQRGARGWEVSKVRGEIHRLCERPYWGRLWVYQELKSARHIVLMCGSDFLPWSRLQNAASSHELARTLAANMITPLASSSDPAITSLWHLISRSMHLRCADPRDRVYALASCANSGLGTITVDYTISTTALVKIVLQNMLAELSYRPTLANVLTWSQEHISIFGLESEAIFDITQGVMKRYDYDCSISVPTEICDGMDREFPHFDTLSRWAQSFDERTVCKSLLQHMGLSFYDLW